LEGAEHGRKLHPQQVNGAEVREKPHTLAEYALDHFRLVEYPGERCPWTVFRINIEVISLM